MNSSSLTREHVPAYSLFAQLLAAERLRVTIERSAKTASFAPAERVLTLPSWSGFSDDAWLLFISHEVGHALFTPSNAFTHPTFVALARRYGQAATGGVVNVFEDIRIERMIREKYRGLSSVFSRGYHALLGSGFFGFPHDEMTPATWAERAVLDRVNLYAKVGGLLRFPLSDAQEMSWYTAALHTHTYDDVLTLVAAVMATLTEEQRTSAAHMCSQTQPKTASNGETATGRQSSQGEQHTAPSHEASTGQETPTRASAQDEQHHQHSPSADAAPSNDSNAASNATDPSSESGAQTASETPSTPKANPFHIASQEHAREMLNRSVYNTWWCDSPRQHMLPANTEHLHWNDVSLREMVAAWQAPESRSSTDNQFRALMRELVASQRREQSSILASMISAFRANQSAWQHRRVQVAKTGSIDPTKLAQYKLIEDLFLRRKTLPEAQNHGFVLHIDMSGSMEPKLSTVLWQVLHLVWFAESIKVPVRVYGFSNMGPDTEEYRAKHAHTPGGLKEMGRLIEWYDSMAPAAVKLDAQALMLTMVLRYSSSFGYSHGSTEPVVFRKESYYSRGLVPKALIPVGELVASKMNAGKATHGDFQRLFYHPYVVLGGTPLFFGLLSSVDTVRAFRQRHRIEQCVSVWLTDGEDTDGVPVEAGDSTSWRDRRAMFSSRRVNASAGQPALIDPRSGRRFEVTEGRGLAALFALHRALTGATVICIDISATPLASYQRVVSRTVLQTLAAQVTTSEAGVAVRGRRTMKPRVEKQTRKRVIVRAQRGTFEETGLMLITNRQYPEIGADAYLVTHPDWWASNDEFSSRQANAAIASSIHRDWQDENNPEDSEDADSQVLDEVDPLTTNRVKLAAALLQTSGEVAMRRFADLLVPYMASGREDATV